MYTWRKLTTENCKWRSIGEVWSLALVWWQVLAGLVLDHGSPSTWQHHSHIDLKFWCGETLGEQNFHCTSFMSCLGEELSQNIYDKYYFIINKDKLLKGYEDTFVQGRLRISLQKNITRQVSSPCYCGWLFIHTIYE